MEFRRVLFRSVRPTEEEGSAERPQDFHRRPESLQWISPGDAGRRHRALWLRPRRNRSAGAHLAHLAPQKILRRFLGAILLFFYGDGKSVVSGTSVSVRVVLGGCLFI